MANAVMSDWPSGVANTGWPSEPSAMLMPGRIQGWPAGTQRASNPATTLLSQAVAWWDVEQYRDGDRFLRNRGTGGELLDLRLGSSIVANSNDPLYLASEDSGYVYLPGVSGNYLSVPDEAALDITGDIDIQIRLSADVWGSSAGQILLDKWNTASQRSYRVDLLTNATVQFYWSTTGSDFPSAISSALPFANRNTGWLRVTLDVNNGAGSPQYVVTFYTANDSVEAPTSWTQLGSPITGSTGPTSIFAGTAGVRLGISNANGAPFAGRYYRAIVKDGIDGTTVLDIDCDAITSGSATSFTASTNQTVTVNRSTSGRKSVAVPSRHKGGRPVMLFGTDDYMEVQDNWQRGSLTPDTKQGFTVVAVVRVWGTPTSNQVYISYGDIASNAYADAAWVLYNSTTNANVRLFASESVYKTGRTGNYYAGASQGYSLGATSVFAGVIDRGLLSTYVGSAFSQVAVRFGDISVDGNRKMQVGRQVDAVGAIAAYANMEFYGAAVFRRALSAAEITTLSNYFTGRIA